MRHLWHVSVPYSHLKILTPLRIMISKSKFLVQYDAIIITVSTIWVSYWFKQPELDTMLSDYNPSKDNALHSVLLPKVFPLLLILTVCKVPIENLIFRFGRCSSRLDLQRSLSTLMRSPLSTQSCRNYGLGSRLFPTPAW